MVSGELIMTIIAILAIWALMIIPLAIVIGRKIRFGMGE